MAFPHPRHFLVAVCATLSLPCGRTIDHAEFALGMPRAEIVERFGEPNRKQILRKADEHIWGAIETFWAQVPLGGEVEIWHYDTQVEVVGADGSTSPEGTTELYFVDGSDTVSGIGFAPRGAVFESDS